MLREIITDDTPQVLAKAIESNIIDQYPFIFSSLPRFEICATEKLVWYSSGIVYPYLNHILLARLNPETIDSEIDEIIDEFKRRSVPVTWSVGPSSRPSELGTYLTGHGLTYMKDETGMAMDLSEEILDQPDPDDLKIKRVLNEGMLQEWFHPVSVSFGYPKNITSLLLNLYSRVDVGEESPWRLFIGYMNGKPVGASRLFFGAGVAGIYHVATVPQVRGRGIGTAMTLAALRDAWSMNYRIAVLRAAERALGVYRRLGFKGCCPFHFYLWPGYEGVSQEKQQS